MEDKSTLKGFGGICRVSLENLVTGRIHQRAACGPELLARFNVWADEAGLFADGKKSLDHQVRNNPKVRAMMQQFLEAMSADARMYGEAEVVSHHLQDMVIDHDTLDGELPNKNVIQSQIKDTIARLIRLLRQMRQHAKDKLDIEGHKYDPRDQDDKPLALEFDEHVRWKLNNHQHWQVKNDVIRSRLQSTMLLRWRRIYYHSMRAEATAKTPLISRHNELTTKIPEVPSLVVSHPKEGKVGLQPVPGGQRIEPVRPMSLPSERLTVGSSFKPHGNATSVVTSRRTKSLIGAKAADFPKAPMLRPELSKFVCPLCGTSQPATERERKTWQLHVLRDLAPYICLHESCCTPHAMYHTSREWIAHMDNMHSHIVWLCQICQHEFPNEVAYKEHISNPFAHGMATNLSPEQITMLASVNAVPKSFGSCFFCTLREDEVDDLRIHMAEHLRQFALASIPWHVLSSEVPDEESNTALAGANSKECDGSLARIEQFIEDESLSFESSDFEADYVQKVGPTCGLNALPEHHDINHRSQVLSWLSTAREGAVTARSQKQPSYPAAHQEAAADHSALAQAIPASEQDGLFSTIDFSTLIRATNSEQLTIFATMGKQPSEFPVDESTALPAYTKRSSRNELKRQAKDNSNLLTKLDAKIAQSDLTSAASSRSQSPGDNIIVVHRR